MSPDVLRVVVLCPSYHGATLLALLLNEHSDVIDLGDFNPEMLHDNPCRCGLTVSGCPFWSAVRRELRPPLIAGGDHWFPKRPPFTRSTRVNTALSYPFYIARVVTGNRGDWPLSRQLTRYRDANELLLRLATQAMGAGVFVDGEKSVEKALFLSSTSDRPVRLIHLTRDPRGFVWSALSRNPGPSRASSSSSIRVEELATSWRRYHFKARLARQLLRPRMTLTIRYEDLASDTAATMDRVFRFIGVSPLGPGSRRRPGLPIHAIGNRTLRTFDGSIALDESWRSELSEAEAKAILRKSGAFAAEQGYR